MEPSVREKYLEAGRIAAEALKRGMRDIKEGVRYLDIAERVEGYIRSQGAGIAFPTNIAVNDVAAHYSPSYDDQSVFRKGDVVKLDVGAEVGGYIADTACTVEVGTSEHQDLINAPIVAHEAIVNILAHGVLLDDIGTIIEKTVNSQGFIVIENLTGHSLRRNVLHAGLTVPNVSGSGYGRLKMGDVIAIEPFATYPDKNGPRLRPERSSVTDLRAHGTIYHLRNPNRKVKTRAGREVLDMIKARWPKLPFCQRWVASEALANSDIYPALKTNDAVMEGIEELLKRRVLYRYFVLRERRGRLVSQFERTYIIGEKGCTITTPI